MENTSRAKVIIPVLVASLAAIGAAIGIVAYNKNK